jgi:hypothetical protein
MNERTAKAGCSIAVSLKGSKAPGGVTSGGNDLARCLMRCSWTPHDIIMVSCLSILKCPSSNLRQRRHCRCRRDNLRPAGKRGLRAWLKMNSAFTTGLSSPPRKRGSRGNRCGLATPGFRLSAGKTGSSGDSLRITTSCWSGLRGQAEFGLAFCLFRRERR